MSKRIMQPSRTFAMITPLTLMINTKNDKNFIRSSKKNGIMYTQCLPKPLQYSCKYRPVVPGCAGCAMAHPDFGRPVNPISTRGDRLCPPNYYWHTRIFRPSDGPEIAHLKLVEQNCNNYKIKIFEIGMKNFHKSYFQSYLQCPQAQ